jgi:hypothetical protein
MDSDIFPIVLVGMVLAAIFKTITFCYNKECQLQAEFAKQGYSQVQRVGETGFIWQKNQ